MARREGVAWDRPAVITGVVALVLATVSLLAGDDLREGLVAAVGALAAGGTVIAAFASLNAARASRDAATSSAEAARRTEKALALHYQPTVGLTVGLIDWAAPPRADGMLTQFRQDDGDPVHVAFGIYGVSVEQVTVAWTGDDGVVRRAEVGQLDGDRGYHLQLTGRTVHAGVVDNRLATPLRLHQTPIEITITCRDTAVRSTWTANLSITHITHPGGPPTKMQLAE